MANGVLVPLDTSDLSAGALSYAASLARALALPLTLLSVWDRTDQDLQGVLTEAQTADLEATALATYREYLEKTAAAPELTGLPVEIRVREGPPAEEILAAVDAERAQYLVIASHGRGGLKRLLLGSVADRLVRAAVVPTLVVRVDGETAAENPPRKILLPLDGSEFAEAALPAATSLAAAFGADLCLVRVVPWATTALVFPMMPAPNVDEIEVAMHEAAASYLNGVEAPGATRRVLRGSPGAELENCIGDEAIDMVVMTSRGRSGLSRWALGSVADHVVRTSHCPVMLVPATG